jgi:hypothetical protein
MAGVILTSSESLQAVLSAQSWPRRYEQVQIRFSLTLLSEYPQSEIATKPSFDPAPNPASFATFDDFVNYIYANNNIPWRNFNVLGAGLYPIKVPFGEFIPLRFLITGAWDKRYTFALETQAELPEGSRMALQVPHWVGQGLRPVHAKLEEVEDSETDTENRQRLRIALTPHGRQALGHIELPAGTAAASYMLVHIPAERHIKPLKVIVRQLYREREVGRITWLMLPRH